MNTIRTSQEHTFTASDGKELFYRAWLPVAPQTDKCFILLHRGHEHSARLQHIVDGLNMPDVPMFAMDARGHGRTEGPRGYSPSVARSVLDLDEFVKHICTTYHIDITNIMLIAQSISAVYASAWVHDYAPHIRGMVLASPAFSIKLYVPFACEGISLWQKIRGQHFFVSSYVNAKFLTHDPARQESYNTDPLISKAIASNILLEIAQLGKRIVADARAIYTPTQVFISGSDVVVHHTPQHKFYERLSSPIKEKHVMEGFYHDTLGEQNRALVFDKMRTFIENIYSTPYTPHDYSNEDRWSQPADEYRDLQAPASFPKSIFYKITRFGFDTIGQLSDGLKLGKQIGFNAGGMLDYVYRNQPSGRFLIGKWFDKMYLKTPGWEGIRQRKINLQNVISQTIEKLRAQNKPVFIFDPAAGRGKYILDLLKTTSADHVLLRDFDAQNVKAIQEAVRENGLSEQVTGEQGDAFQVEKTASVTPKPTLAVVSGFYEIFPTNEGIKKSLEGLSKAVEKGGFLIYTAQPYHPQLELIARTLRDLESPDKLWIMRAHTQGEMDFLVEKAGFVKQSQIIDKWGMFSVSVAQKQ